MSLNMQERVTELLELKKKELEEVEAEIETLERELKKQKRKKPRAALSYEERAQYTQKLNKLDRLIVRRRMLRAIIREFSEGT